MSLKEIKMKKKKYMNWNCIIYEEQKIIKFQEKKRRGMGKNKRNFTIVNEVQRSE